MSSQDVRLPRYRHFSVQGSSHGDHNGHDIDSTLHELQWLLF